MLKAAVVAKLKKDDVLEVALQTMAGSNVVIVRFNGNPRAAWQRQVARLRECIEQGIAFEAIVLQVNQGQVKVRVKAVE